MRPNSDSSNYLSEPSGIFNLTNLVANATCLKLKIKGILIDVMLTNRPKCFFKLRNFF